MTDAELIQLASDIVAAIFTDPKVMKVKAARPIDDTIALTQNELRALLCAFATFADETKAQASR